MGAVRSAVHGSARNLWSRDPPSFVARLSRLEFPAGDPVKLRLLAAILAACATAAVAQGLPKYPAKDVPETFFGTVVHDPYRGLENVKDPAVAAWMKAHADYAKSQLEGLKGYAGLKARVAELD